MFKKMLTLTLRYLERDGFISRKTPSTPPSVDYALTALGEEVMGLLEFLAQRALDNRHHVVDALSAYDEVERA